MGIRHSPTRQVWTLLHVLFPSKTQRLSVAQPSQPSGIRDLPQALGSLSSNRGTSDWNAKATLVVSAWHPSDMLKAWSGQLH